MNIIKKITNGTIPKHIAIIMDGNGRWALERGENRFYGHKQGVKTVFKIVEAAMMIDVKYLTLFAFSRENWGRPKHEIKKILQLLSSTIKENEKHFLRNKIKLKTIGNINDLPTLSQKLINQVVNKTKNNNKITIYLALSYSSKNEIIEAVKKIIKEKKYLDTEIDEKLISQNLQTYNCPDPELLIRTSGEKRISNFLLWQIAYSELYFSKKKWPDFDAEELYMAIFEYQKRERRFGKTTEQIEKK